MDDSSQHATPASTEPYVDIYLLPIPEADLDAYRLQASAFGSHGGFKTFVTA